jgi:hypothetical protein
LDATADPELDHRQPRLSTVGPWWFILAQCFPVGLS